MPGIFSSCIISNRLGKPDIRRTRGFGSCSRNSKYSSETSRTESSYGSFDDVDRAFTSIHIDGLGSQGSDLSSHNTSVISATTRSTNPTATSRGFYSNKEHNAMIFSSKSDENRNMKGFVRTRKERQFEPPPSPCPCEWGYFVDTA